ncbi:acyltransferase [Paracoccus sp. 1_MG-2023]|uniref:acyltransferase family protein n=1 Tax=unclassified Paracoccus (in: a-proteobacteria) TaxID=2688777 RepID=UPI001C091409|nr:MULTISPECIES: acyltransferase [unclassified Paracoccus (in: a-proteobacteria)]MBU2958920.1 acyltransferase [Paracoccus sp. C2R09]MDO6669990.1 acyltransferase [Paracoccus sp. 1_MG-2023]
MLPDRGRSDRIDTLRAIACIGLVAFHVVGSSPGTGLELPGTHWLSRINLGLVDLRMPLFSFLSGLVFHLQAGAALPRIMSKARRLLLPMASVGTLFWLARDAMGYAQPSLPQILILPFAHFWFLQSTFLIMSLFILGSVITGGRNRLVATIIGLAGAGLYVSTFRFEHNIMSANNAFRLAPFFATGFLVSFMPAWKPSPRQRGMICAVLLATIATGLMIGWEQISFAPQARRMVSIILGLVFCVMIFLAAPRHAGMAWLGRQSYAIYLLHVFFTAGTITAMHLVLPGMPIVILFCLALAAGLLGPAALGRMLKKHPLTAFLFLGLRHKKRVTAASPQGMTRGYGTP